MTLYKTLTLNPCLSCNICADVLRVLQIASTSRPHRARHGQPGSFLHYDQGQGQGHGQGQGQGHGQGQSGSQSISQSVNEPISQ